MFACNLLGIFVIRSARISAATLSAVNSLLQGNAYSRTFRISGEYTGQILMDGRPLPEPTQPSYHGYSVGRWEGDTLVVEINGVNDQGWLDMNGHPQTETTHFTERYTRRNFGHIDLEVTVEDPKAYARPWTVKLAGLDLMADEELIEAICENERDYSHLIGK